MGQKRAARLVLAALIVGGVTTGPGAAVSAQGEPPRPKATPTTGPAAGASADALRREGVARFLQGDTAGAQRALEEAARLAREAGNRVGEGAAQAYLGQVYESQDQYPRALDAYQQVLALA